MKGSPAEAAALRQKALEVEAGMAGQQLRWASTPSSVPALRRKGVLFSGTFGNRRYYAFANGLDQELFVYDRHDTLFTVSRDLRAALGLSPPVFAGTYMSRAAAEPAAAPAPRRRQSPAKAVPAPAPPQPVAPAAKVNKYRK